VRDGGVGLDKWLGGGVQFALESTMKTAVTFSQVKASDKVTLYLPYFLTSLLMSSLGC